MQRNIFGFLLALFLALPAFCQPAALGDIDAYIQRAMQTFDVPGVAVAVVKGGQVVLAKGYGVRKLGESAGVDAYTLFGIGSDTKAFTTASLGILVDEGNSPGTIAWWTVCPASRCTTRM